MLSDKLYGFLFPLNLKLRCRNVAFTATADAPLKYVTEELGNPS